MRRFPIEAAETDDQAMLGRAPADVPGLDHRILQMRGHDFQIVPIERDKLYILQAVGYLVFLFTIGGLYFRSLNSRNSLPGKNGKSSSKTAEKPVRS